MSATSIEWTQRPGTKGEVWNFLTGCNKVSQGCKFCYAETMHRRLQSMMPGKYDHDFLSGAHVHEDLLELPRSWKTPRTVFVNSMSDFFHERVPYQILARAMFIMEQEREHTFLILTKRAHAAKAFFEYMQANNVLGFRTPPNVWIGVTVEDQETANERIPILLSLNCRRFISYEPALGPLNLRVVGSADEPLDVLRGIKYKAGLQGIAMENLPTIHWVIVGGESGGQTRRPMHPFWVHRVQLDCNQFRVPFFFKQWGAYMPDDQGKYVVHSDGAVSLFGGSTDGEKFMPRRMSRVNKKNSGNFLDGKQWLEFPKF